MKNSNKYVRYFGILYIGIPLIYILFFNDPIGDEIKYLQNEYIKWVIEAKYIDENNKKMETIEYYDTIGKKKTKSEIHLLMYRDIYNYLQIGDTLVKTKGELLFYVKRGKESKSFLIIPPEK